MSIERSTSAFHSANPSNKHLDVNLNTSVTSSDPSQCEKKKLCRVNKGYKLEDSRKLLGTLTTPSHVNLYDRPSPNPDKRASTESSELDSYRSGVVSVARTVGKSDDEKFVYIIVAPVKEQYVSEYIDSNNSSDAGGFEDEHYDRNQENEFDLLRTGRSNSVSSLPSRPISRRVFFSEDVIVHSLIADNDGVSACDVGSNCIEPNITDFRECDNDVEGSLTPSEQFIGREVSTSVSSDDSICELNSQYLPVNAHTVDEKPTPSSPPANSRVSSQPLRQIIPTHLAERSKKLTNTLKRLSQTATAAVTNLNNTGDIARTANRPQPKLHRLSRSKASGRISSSKMEHKLVVGAGADGQMLQLFISLDARRFRPDDLVIRTCASGYNIRVMSTDVLNCRRCSLDCGDGIRYSSSINETFALPVPIDATHAVANLSPQGCLLIQAPMIIRGYRTTGPGDNAQLLVSNCKGNGNVRIAQENKLEFIL